MEITEKIKTKDEVKYRKYQLGKMLGKGGFAKCYQFTD